MGQEETKRRSQWDGKSRVRGGTSGPWRRAHRWWCTRGEAGMGRGCLMHQRWTDFPGQPGPWMLHCYMGSEAIRGWSVPAEQTQSISPGKILQEPCVRGCHRTPFASRAPSAGPQPPHPTQEEVVGEEQPLKDPCPQSRSTHAHADPSSGTAGGPSRSGL